MYTATVHNDSQRYTPVTNIVVRNTCSVYSVRVAVIANRNYRVQKCNYHLNDLSIFYCHEAIVRSTNELKIENIDRIKKKKKSFSPLSIE